jgi:lysophospholipase L1-like esterase
VIGLRSWFVSGSVGLACLLVGGCQGGQAQPPATTAPTSKPTSASIIALARASPSPSPSRAPSPSPAARPLAYVAIGASDTVGVGADDPAHNGWVPRLAQLLGPNVRVHNLGVSGTLLRTARQDQLPVAIREQPDLVTVWLAVNDLNAHVPLDQYFADLDGLLASLADQTHAVVLVANVPDLTHVPLYRDQDPGALRSTVKTWNEAITNAAERHRAHVVDLFAEYAELAAHPEDLSSDGFHPSSAGYARIADLFFSTARPLLGR